MKDIIKKRNKIIKKEYKILREKHYSQYDAFDSIARKYNFDVEYIRDIVFRKEKNGMVEKLANQTRTHLGEKLSRIFNG